MIQEMIIKKLLGDHCYECGKKDDLIISNRHVRKDRVIIIYHRCNDCNTARLKEYRKTENGKIVFYNIIKRQQIKHRNKVNARGIMNYHLKVGHLSKPLVCSKCLLKKKLEGHHEDYSKPLEVMWLCRKCHKVVDKKLSLKQSIL